MVAQFPGRLSRQSVYVTAAFNSTGVLRCQIEILGPEFAIMEDLVYSKRSGVTIGESLTISAYVRKMVN